MDNRWKFRYHPQAVNSDGEHSRVGAAGRWSCPSKPVGRSGRQIPLVNPERRVRGKLSTEVADPTLARKTPSEDCRCPYRKPTQVGKERILRRARQPSLRNSAK